MVRSPISLIGFLLPSCLLGAVTAVAVAWISAWRFEEGRRPESGIVIAADGGAWDAELVKDAFVERWLMRPQRSFTMPVAPRPQLPAPGWLDLPDTASVSGWSKTEALGAGWPFVCLRAESSFDVLHFNPTAAVWRHAYVLESGSTVFPFSAKVLPLGIVWTGMAGNIAMWGAAWAVVFAIALAARRQLRCARGRCVVCGYDLRGCRGARCPECGARRLQRDATEAWK